MKILTVVVILILLGGVPMAYAQGASCSVNASMDTTNHNHVNVSASFSGGIAGPGQWHTLTFSNGGGSSNMAGWVEVTEGSGSYSVDLADGNWTFQLNVVGQSGCSTSITVAPPPPPEPINNPATCSVNAQIAGQNSIVVSASFGNAISAPGVWHTLTYSNGSGSSNIAGWVEVTNGSGSYPMSIDNGTWTFQMSAVGNPSAVCTSVLTVGSNEPAVNSQEVVIPQQNGNSGNTTQSSNPENQTQGNQTQQTQRRGYKTPVFAIADAGIPIGTRFSYSPQNENLGVFIHNNVLWAIDKNRGVVWSIPTNLEAIQVEFGNRFIICYQEPDETWHQTDRMGTFVRNLDESCLSQ